MELTQIVDDIGTIGKVVTALTGVVLAILKTRDAYRSLFSTGTKLLLRRAITADLELLKLMEESDPGYEELRNHIKVQVEKMTKEEEKPEFLGVNLRELWEFLRQNLVKLGFWLAIAVVSGYGTYDIVTGPTSNWWAILTGWLALWGIQSLIGLVSKPPSDQASENDQQSTQQAPEEDPGLQPTTTEPPGV